MRAALLVVTLVLAGFDRTVCRLRTASTSARKRKPNRLAIAGQHHVGARSDRAHYSR